MGTASNRFDLIRLVFASLVFLYHGVVLSSADIGGAFELHLATLAELSIQGFFIVSGALVYGSFQRSAGWLDYGVKRVRRLYPAYVVVILIPAACSFAITFNQAGAWQEVVRYLGANLIFLNFLEPNLPGLFDGQRFTEVNGALWTLKIEVMFYIALPLIVLILRGLGKFWWLGLALIVIAAFAWRDLALALDHPLSAQLARQLPGQMMYFAAGMALWHLWALARAEAAILFVLGALALIFSLSVPHLDALRVIGLFGVIAGVAFMPGPTLNAARFGDVSYGVYIVHFPIVQTLVALGVFETMGTIGGMMLATVLVFASSYLLWWCVERPALRRDSHYRQASEEKVPE